MLRRHRLLTILRNPSGGAAQDPLMEGLVDYWALEEATGNRASYTGGNTFTDNGGVTSAAGVIGDGAQFASASSQYLEIPAKVWGISTALSLSWWYIATGDGCLVQLGEDASSAASSVIKYAISSFLGGAYIYGGNGDEVFYRDIAHSDGVLTHVVLTIDGTTLKVYHDGVETSKTESNGVANPFADNSRRLLLGAGRNGGMVEFSNSVVDELGLWSRALTDAEVLRLYNGGAGLAPPFTV